MAVDLEDRLSQLLVEHAEWLRLTDRFAPGTGGPLRVVELADTGHALPAPRPAVEDEVAWAVPGVTGLQATPELVRPTVGELVQRYVALGEQLATVDVSLLDPAQALGEVAALTAAQHTVRTMLMARTRDVGERELYRLLGYRGVGAWQRDTAPDTPRSERTLSRRLGELPHLREALHRRQVSFRVAQAVGSTLADLNAHPDRPDALIDGRPGDEVLAEVCAGALDLIAEHHFGLRDDDPADTALLTRLDERLGQIATCPSSQLDLLEQLLVLLAVELPTDTLGGVLEHIRLQLLPSVLERQEREAQHARDLKLKPNRDGTWDLRATLTPEVGEQLFTALAAEARRDPANPLDTHAREALRDSQAAAAQAAADTAAAQAASAAVQAEVGSDTGSGAEPGVLDEVLSGLLTENDPWEARPLGVAEGSEPVRPRSRGQRLHDAAGRLLTRYLEHGLGGVRSKIPVQLTTVLNERTLRGAPGAPPARGGSGRPLARSLVQRLWCNGHVTALLVSDGMIPLGVVHTQRNVTAVEMKAVLVQFGNRCPGIGCCSGEPDPLTPLVAHHLDMFSKTGRTSIRTTLPCCETLHADIHLGGTILRLRDGSFISEDGVLHPAE